MAPGPASLENKPERPSSDQQATTLFSLLALSDKPKWGGRWDFHS